MIQNKIYTISYTDAFICLFNEIISTFKNINKQKEKKNKIFVFFFVVEIAYREECDDDSKIKI
jgi:hypothetical protein